MKMFVRLLFGVLILFLFGCSFQQHEASPPTATISPTVTPGPTKVVFLPTRTPIPTATPDASGIPLPPDGQFYQGVYPGGTTGEEDDITLGGLLDYENVVNKKATWVYFSNNWYRSRKFPVETASWIRNAGSIPYIRLMLRSKQKFNNDETVYTLQNIIDGKFDQALRAWCMDARNFGTPLLVEYGTEVNSDSFPWSGVANGAGSMEEYGDPTLPDGPERFKDAYRHIIQICRDAGAVNITWVFHLDGDSTPEAAWNKSGNYYPGNNWIDWIGISIYGAYTPMSPYHQIFKTSMDRVYAEIRGFAPRKPIIIAEFGSAKNNPIVDQVQWARDALTVITSSDYKNLIGFSWWNEYWQNDGNRAHDTTMRVQDNPDLGALFQKMIGRNSNVIGKIP